LRPFRVPRLQAFNRRVDLFDGAADWSFVDDRDEADSSQLAHVVREAFHVYVEQVPEFRCRALAFRYS
jgi:hypothetical protein